MPTAPVRDIDIYYEVFGSGPPLLNISGSGNDLRQSMPRLHPLNKHFTVCHYDQRGLGRTVDSVVGDDPGPATMADYAADAASLVDHLGWERPHVVGTSFGGMVAQHLVLAHPDRVNRLVLACTSSGGAGGASADLLALAALPEEEAVVTRGNLFDTRNDIAAGVLAPGMGRIIEHFTGRRTIELSELARNGQRRQLEARGGHDTYDRLGEITAPTMVIGGAHDGIAPPQNLEALAERLPNARLEWCDGGHVFLLQDRTAWPTIIAFLNDEGPS